MKDNLKEVAVPTIDVQHAPFIFYDSVTAIGSLCGVINITLGASRTWINQDRDLVNDHVAVAFLRCNIQAAMGLRDSLDRAILMAVPAAEGEDFKGAQ